MIRRIYVTTVESKDKSLVPYTLPRCIVYSVDYNNCSMIAICSQNVAGTRRSQNDPFCFPYSAE